MTQKDIDIKLAESLKKYGKSKFTKGNFVVVRDRYHQFFKHCGYITGIKEGTKLYTIENNRHQWSATAPELGLILQ